MCYDATTWVLLGTQPNPPAALVGPAIRIEEHIPMFFDALTRELLRIRTNPLIAGQVKPCAAYQCVNPLRCLAWRRTR
jgi:hypothetical protein